MSTASSSSSVPRDIVIIGGGIIGVCTAYYLVTDPSLPDDTTVTLVEGTSIAAGASGHAGGFLARDEKWFTDATLGMSSMFVTCYYTGAIEPNSWNGRTLCAVRDDGSTDIY